MEKEDKKDLKKAHNILQGVLGLDMTEKEYEMFVEIKTQLILLIGENVASELWASSSY